jgi:hypothetical protein
MLQKVRIRQLNRIILLGVVFLFPLLYQSWHVFTHHWHELSCSHSCGNVHKAGINLPNIQKHCPIVEFELNQPKLLANTIALSNAVYFILNEILFYVKDVKYTSLFSTHPRAPPASFIFI